MALSNELVSQFAKLVKEKPIDNGTSIKGTVRVIGDKKYVQLDGSELLTPVELSVEVANDERVKVLIKDHMATVVENITSPAARNTSVEDLKDEVDEQGNTIQQMDNTIIQQGNSIIQMNTTINQHDVSINQHDTLINQQGDEIVSLNNTIVQQGNTISSMNNTIIQQGNNIDSMNNTIIEHGNTITQHGNTITQIDSDITTINSTLITQGSELTILGSKIDTANTNISLNTSNIEASNARITIAESNIDTLNSNVNIQGSNITILNSGFTIVDGKLTGLSEIMVESLTTNTLNVGYAKIDFSNIITATIQDLFVRTGMFENLHIEEGIYATGEIVGVTIKGDLIEGNTIKADKLVVQGTDGLYYKLNISGNTVETEQTPYNSLDGSIITAQSVTASKITVDDLVAFGATIAGFVINENAIYSAGKESINSNALGLYMDKTGQFYLGDSADHIKYYKDENDNFILDIRAKEISLGLSGEKKIDGTTVDLVNDTKYTLDHISNIFNITGGSNLIKNSVWYYKTGELINDWVIADGTTYSGGQDDGLIGYTVSRGHISITNGSAQTDIDNISNILKGRSIGFGFKYKQTSNVVSKVELYDGRNTDNTPLMIIDLTENTNGEFVDVFRSFISDNTNYIVKITSNSTSNNEIVISDMMFNYGEEKGWELASGEIFGTIVKINNLGISITSDTANTETNINTDGMVIFNKATRRKVTDFTDEGINTDNITVRNKIIQKKMINDIITTDTVDIYIEYIADE